MAASSEWGGLLWGGSCDVYGAWEGDRAKVWRHGDLSVGFEGTEATRILSVVPRRSQLTGLAKEMVQRSID